MATINSVDSLGELTSLLKDFSSTSGAKKITDLQKSIDSLTNILASKTGAISKNKEDDNRTFKKDITAFFQQPVKDVKGYLGIKNKMPENVELKQEDGTGKKNEEITAEGVRTRVSKMKASPIQKKMLEEVIKIKSLLANPKGSATPAQTGLSGTGLEPNSDEAKQKDRELLAEAIAEKLADLLKGMGSEIGAGFGIPDSPDKNQKKTPGSKAPPAKVPGRGGVRIGGPLATGMIGYELATAGNEVVDTGDPVKDPVANANNAGVKAIREKLLGKDTPEEKIPLKESLSPGEEVVPSISKSQNPGEEVVPSISKSQKNVSTKELKNVNKVLNEQRETEKDKLKDAPWYTKMFGVGKEDYLKTVPTEKPPEKTKEQEAKEWMQRQEEASKMYPNKKTNTSGNLLDPKPIDSEKKYGSPKVDPVPSGDKKINFLKKIEDQNNELKDASTKLSSQIITPMISNNNIDNSRQTVIPAAPNPYPSGRGYNNFQSRVDGKL
jgi:hypothetical protein